MVLLKLLIIINASYSRYTINVSYRVSICCQAILSACLLLTCNSGTADYYTKSMCQIIFIHCHNFIDITPICTIVWFVTFNIRYLNFNPVSNVTLLPNRNKFIIFFNLFNIDFNQRHKFHYHYFNSLILALFYLNSIIFSIFCYLRAIFNF